MEDKDLKNLREQIEKLDKELITLLSKRMGIVEDVVKYKVKHKIDILDESREEKLKYFWLDSIEDKNITKQESELLLNTIFKISKDRQAEIKRMFTEMVKKKK